MLNFERKEKIEIVSFSVKRINALIADDIRDRINKLFDNPNSKVIIDLRGVEYIDSSGFGCFLSIMRTARNNYGVLKFSNPETAVMNLFNTLHLNTVFHIFENIDDCINSFK